MLLQTARTSVTFLLDVLQLRSHGVLDKVRRVPHLGLFLHGGCEERHRHFGQVIVDDVVDSAGPDELLGDLLINMSQIISGKRLLFGANWQHTCAVAVGVSPQNPEPHATRTRLS